MKQLKDTKEKHFIKNPYTLFECPKCSLSFKNNRAETATSDIKR